MKEFKGTPGPWRVSEKRGDLIDIRHNSNGIGAISLNLAHVVARQSWLKEAEANAKLIAAAPELLAALRDIIEASTPFHSALEIDQQFDGEALYSNAVKAIKKASGEWR